jgi:hypothetical protein
MYLAENIGVNQARDLLERTDRTSSEAKLHSVRATREEFRVRSRERRHVATRSSSNDQFASRRTSKRDFATERAAHFRNEVRIALRTGGLAWASWKRSRFSASQSRFAATPKKRIERHECTEENLDKGSLGLYPI